MLRLTGLCLRTERKSGTSERGPWAFDIVRVLVGDADFIDVTYDQSKVAGGVAPPRAGDEVDYAIQASIRPGKNGFGPSLNLDVKGDYSLCAGSQRPAPPKAVKAV